MVSDVSYQSPEVTNYARGMDGVYRAGGLDYEFGKLTYQIIELQTVETVERIIRPIGRDDREDVELLTILFNVDSAEEGI
jgi:hypothetical protein